MKTIYIDILFLVNLIVDMMLFVSALSLRRARIVWWRMLAASAVGAACSCVVFFADIPPWLYNLGAIALYALCALLVFGWKSGREYLKNAASTIFCALVFAGVFFFIYRYFDFGSVVVFNHNVLYVDIPVFVLLCVSFVCFGIIWLASRFFTRVIGSDSEYRAFLTLNEKQISLKARIDTANHLVDPLTGYPVVLASAGSIAGLFPGGLPSMTADPELLRQGHFRLIACQTATGEGVLLAFRPDKLILQSRRRTYTCRRLLIAISEQPLDGADLYLNAQIFQEVDRHV